LIDMYKSQSLEIFLNFKLKKKMVALINIKLLNHIIKSGK
jgi:hypothetical protein